MRIQQGSINFDCQYQNQPVDPKGNMLRRDWLHFYVPDTLPRQDIYYVQGVDPCYSASIRSDLFAHITLGMTPQGQAYAVALNRGHLDPQAELERIIKLGQDWHPRKIGIESNASQSLLVQLAASHESNLPVEGIPTKGEKLQRFSDMAAYFQRGQILIPGHANEEGEFHPTPEWLPFVEEWLSFPLGAHDDCLDAMEKAIAVLSFASELAYGVGTVFSQSSTRLSSRLRPSILSRYSFRPVTSFGYDEEEPVSIVSSDDEMTIKEAKEEMYKRNRQEGNSLWGITLSPSGRGWILKRGD